MGAIKKELKTVDGKTVTKFRTIKGKKHFLYKIKTTKSKTKSTMGRLKRDKEKPQMDIKEWVPNQGKYYIYLPITSKKYLR